MGQAVTDQRDEGASSVLTPNLVQAILQFTAVAVTDPDPSTPAAIEMGTGGLNALGAITLAKAIDPTMPVGAWWTETAVLPASVLAGTSYSWAQHIVWGDDIVWGDAEHIVWGDLSDEHIVWVDNDEHIVWGDDDEHIVWGDSIIGGDGN